VLAAVFLSSSVAQNQDFATVFAPIMSARRFAEVAISPDGERVVWVESKVKSDTEYAHAVFVKPLNAQTSPQEVGPGDPRAILGHA
jgi:hypothetical protein